MNHESKSSSAANPYQSPASIEGSESVDVGFDRAGLRTTGLGLRLVYFGVLTLLVTVIALIVVRWNVIPLPGVLIAVSAGIGVLLTLIGPLFCLSVPAQTGLRRWIIAAVACPFVTMLFGVIARMLGIRIPYEFLWALSWPLGSAFFLAFLIRLARYIRRFDLAKQGRITLYGGLLFVLLAIPMGFFVGFPMVALAVVVQVAFFIGLLILFVSYVNLIHSLAKAIRRPHASEA